MLSFSHPIETPLSQNINQFILTIVVGDHPEHASPLRSVPISWSKCWKWRLGSGSRRKQKLLRERFRSGEIMHDKLYVKCFLYLMQPIWSVFVIIKCVDLLLQLLHQRLSIQLQNITFHFVSCVELHFYIKILFYKFNIGSIALMSSFFRQITMLNKTNIFSL